MQVTIQTKASKEAEAFLEETAKHIGSLRGKLLKDLLKGENLNKLKKQYRKKEGLLARQFNSMANEVRGVISSTKELQKRNMRESKQRQKNLKKRIKLLTKKLKKTNAACGVAGKKSPRKNLEFQLHQKKRKLAKQEAKIARMEEKKISICLGSKKLFKAQFNLEENGYESHKEWQEEFRKARSNRIFYLGSHDEKFGNQNCQLIGDKLQIRVLPALEEKYGKYVHIPVKFNYGQKIINYALTKGQAINYRFVRKNEQWYLFLTTKREPEQASTKKELGAIGVDMNKAHLAWAETDRFGNLIKFDRINTPTQDRRKEQVKATLGEAVKTVVKYAKKQQKPVVIEELDFTKKKNSFEGMSKAYRRMLSYFAYATFYMIMLAKTWREGVELIVVPPEYSSIIGKYKFSQMYGISVHIAASLVLARRGLRFSERLPANYARCLAVHKHRHVWNSWRSLVHAVSNRDQRVELVSRRLLWQKSASTGGG